MSAENARIGFKNAKCRHIEMLARAALRMYPDADRQAVDEAVSREVDRIKSSPITQDEYFARFTKTLARIVVGAEADPDRMDMASDFIGIGFIKAQRNLFIFGREDGLSLNRG